MKLLVAATRMWLTRSFRSFQFKNEYDNKLVYHNTDQLGLYIHIPFCKNICSFCPYCKEKFYEARCEKYIEYLIKEIHMVGYSSKKEVTSLYFGGGTPALAINKLKDIINAVNEHFIITEGIGLELHPDNVTEENLLMLKEAGITKISIGIQSFQDKFLDLLGRSKTDYKKMFEALKKVRFETVSMDFIFALPGQKIEDLKRDIETAFANGANHIAIYPFIDFSFTDSKIPVMSKKEKRQLLDDITIYCRDKGYHRDSIWTFSNHSEAKYSSMTRDNFLGFGCSATTLLKDQFKINTFSVDAYHGTPLSKVYRSELWIAKKLGFVSESNGVYQMTLKGAFYYHYYENHYTLSYIDKMWGIMRKEAFPRKIQL